MNSITKFITNNKNIFSTIFAFLMFAYEPLNSYFNSQPFEWKSFIFLCFGAVVSFSVGKYPSKLVYNGGISNNTQDDICEKGYATSEDLSKPKIDKIEMP